MISEISVTDYTAALASGEPTPGGGAAAALAGALGAALVAMVCNFTIGRRKFEPVEPEMRALLARSDQIRAEMLDLAEADAHAYDAYVEAVGLPKEDPNRDSKLQAAVAGAIQIPLRAAVLAADVVALAEPIAERGNPRLASDAGVAALLADAALHAAALNVRANYPSLRDGKVRDDSEAVLARLFAATRELKPRILQLVEKRTG